MLKRTLTVFTAVIMAFLLVSPSAFASSKGDKVSSIAHQYIGTPYKYGGTTPSGFDCSGFLQYVYNKIDVSIPRTSAAQSDYGTAVSKSNLQPGDLVYFSNTYKPGVSHSGVYVGDGKFIHASSSGVKKSSINDPYYWGDKYTGARRVIKEERLPTLPKGQYHDVPADYWAETSISYLSMNDIINGYDQSLFKPNNTITRAEVATMLAKSFNLPLEDGASMAPDVSSKHWAKEEINAVMKKGFFGGYSDGTFRPDRPITRSEIASLFTRAFNLSQEGSGIAFSDVSKNYWAYGSIQVVTSNDIAGGYSDNTFRPTKNATRAEFSVFLHRALLN
ncbi:S-layer homology domain-containing protein [Pseudalkalibacillus berkeleyi]|uniref:S-layer homology domain-containing protein n=1 Tax=Pseudalkalibacillus berkeleyi TaxID=1069813 RepID=A0ABS9H1A8_9BACL|nr:C40 family peptidase [Pseudalkalibacillus berkeleyi]MCF6138782.1 S-layer homology domain-containing protein [Pseudalkalibacillus berkeleyi]